MNLPSILPTILHLVEHVAVPAMATIGPLILPPLKAGIAGLEQDGKAALDAEIAKIADASQRSLAQDLANGVDVWAKEEIGSI